MIDEDVARGCGGRRSRPLLAARSGGARPFAARSTAWLVACAGLAVAAHAAAQTIETVVTKDGSAYEGALVEKVVGERVVVQLATGEIKTIPWDAIASVTPAPAAALPAAPAPLAPAIAPVVVGTPDSGHVITGWPDPHDKPVRASSVTAPSGPRIDLGLHTSLPQFGSAIGVVGLLAAYKPTSWLGFEVAGGYDGPVAVSSGDLGWSVAQTLRFGDTWGLGLGVSEHFGAKGTGMATMGHAELFFDVDLEGMVSAPLGLRLAPGVTTMFNPGSHPGACGFPFNMLSEGNFDENGNVEDRRCLLIYFNVELLYHVKLGRKAESAP